MNGFPRDFLSYNNFESAFTRVVRGANKDYKAFYKHLFPSYNLALRENLLDVIDDLKRGRFAPEKPTLIFQPKKSGVLRPLTLLSLRDLIVYQAIVNRVAVAFESEQQRYALKKSFGALFAGRSSDFFFRSWKESYKQYNHAIETAFENGNDFIADFDLVSFYELIEHGLLAEQLRQRIKNDTFIELLITCLERWTLGKAGATVGHGVPQGPEPSAFLAECFLFHFDSANYRGVTYLRYVDDIRLMGKDEVPIRRALLRLDLHSKELGLVPQAQKIACRRVSNLDQVLKTIPSPLADSEADPHGKSGTQASLIKVFRQSLKKLSSVWIVDDTTKFKFSLNRLNARRDVLRRIAPVLSSRPDLSWVLSSYIKRFGRDREAADILLENIRRDPTYDAAAANYIDALDVCEPASENAKYRRVIQTATQRSEENSILLSIASGSFRGRRRSSFGALALIASEKNCQVQTILLHRLFGSHPTAPFNTGEAATFLQHCAESPDPDLARFSAGLLIDNWPWTTLSAPKSSNRAVLLLFQALGVRRRAPKKAGVLDRFFQEKYKIGISIPWAKALGTDLREAERRCLRFQRLLLGDPTVRITLLDTFNELLLQNVSTRHPTLKTPYLKAIPPKAKMPDLGNWLRHPALTNQLPVASKWFLKIHDARVAGEYAHAKAKATGKPTRPISFAEAQGLMRRAQSAWAEMIKEWKSLF